MKGMKSVHPFLVFGLTIKAVLFPIACYMFARGLREFKDNNRPGSSALVFLALNVVVSAIVLTSRKPSEEVRDLRISLVAYQEASRDISEGAAHASDGESVPDQEDLGGACTGTVLKIEDAEVNQHHQVDTAMDELAVVGDVNRIADGVVPADDETDEDPGELQRRAEEFIAKIIRGWMEEKHREKSMHPP